MGASNNDVEVRLSLVEKRQADYYRGIDDLKQELGRVKESLVDQFEATARGLSEAVLASVRLNKEDIVNLQRRLDNAEEQGTTIVQLLNATVKQVESHRRLLFGNEPGDAKSITELAHNSLRVARAAEQTAQEGLAVARAVEQGLDRITDIVERLVTAEEHRAAQRQVLTKTVKVIMDKGPWIAGGIGFLATSLSGVWTSVVGQQKPTITLIVVAGGVAFTLFFAGVLVMLRAAMNGALD